MVDGERIDTAHILPQLDMNLLITMAAFLVRLWCYLFIYAFGFLNDSLKNDDQI